LNLSKPLGRPVGLAYAADTTGEEECERGAKARGALVCGPVRGVSRYPLGVFAWVTPLATYRVAL
jgi:hypothetical protein